MAYTPVHAPWRNLPNRTTPVNAAAIGHIEQGVVDAHEQIDGRLSEAGLNATYAPVSVASDVTALGEDVAAKLSKTDADTFYAPASGSSFYVAKTALKALANNRGLYLPSPSANLKWRVKREQALRGNGVAHIAALGDSITFGAAATGNTSPKWLNSWPGQLRTALDAEHGPSGTGIVPAIPALRTNPTWDPRFTFTGTITDHAFGFHKATCYRLKPGATLEFTADNVDKFRVFLFSGGDTVANEAQIDGGAVETIRNSYVAHTVTIDRLSGYHDRMLVTDIPAGAVGTHTLKLTRPASATSDMFFMAVHGMNASQGRFRVSNLGYSSKSLASFSETDETNSLFGLPLIDAVKADLLIVALGINDWQALTNVATTKARLTSIVQRQRANGTNAGGGANANGDALLVWNPAPDFTTLTQPYWEIYRDMFYEVANEQNVALLDMGDRWKDYPTANALGLFADAIHPTDAGSADIAPAIEDTLFDG